jgi:TPR repeat protein
MTSAIRATVKLPSAPSFCAEDRMTSLIALYRANPIFRSCLELVVVGCAALVFSGQISNPFRPLFDLIAASQTKPTVQAVEASKAASFATQDGGIAGGVALRALLEPWRLTDITEHNPTLPAEVKSALQAAHAKLGAGELAEARRILRALGGSTPELKYALAVIELRGGAAMDRALIKRMLKEAQVAGYAPALTALARMHLRAIMEMVAGPNKTGVVTDIDEQGQEFTLSLDQLRSTMAQLFDRAAALGDPVAMRALGVLQARPLPGGAKPNLQAAIARFRDAASRGDAPSATEIGILTSLGAGVSADAPTAQSFLARGAARESVGPGHLAQAIDLLAEARKTGDRAKAQQAVATVERVVANAEDRILKAEAYKLLGDIWWSYLPTAMQDPVKAFDNYQRAFATGLLSEALPLAMLYRDGKGVSRDVVVGYAYLLVLEAEGLADFARKLRLQFNGLLTEQQQAAAEIRARQIRSQITQRIYPPGVTPKPSRATAPAPSEPPRFNAPFDPNNPLGPRPGQSASSALR